MINVAAVHIAENEIDRHLPRGIERIRGGITLEVSFDSDAPAWGAWFTYQLGRSVRTFSTNGVYAAPSEAVIALLQSVRTTPKDLW